MPKKLSTMTLEELWQLFPITLVEHQVCWKDWFAQERLLLQSLLPQHALISHIGSTAIDGIWAKPIVDILVELPEATDFKAAETILINQGYICMQSGNSRSSFNKGYTESGYAEQVFHIHVRYLGDNDEVYFRDYLLQHKDVAKQYEGLKLRLWKQYEHDRDAYTNAKSDFIKAITEKAKNEKSNL